MLIAACGEGAASDRVSDGKTSKQSFGGETSSPRSAGGTLAQGGDADSSKEARGGTANTAISSPAVSSGGNGDVSTVSVARTHVAVGGAAITGSNWAMGGNNNGDRGGASSGGRTSTGGSFGNGGTAATAASAGVRDTRTGSLGGTSSLGGASGAGAAVGGAASLGVGGTLAGGASGTDSWLSGAAGNSATDTAFCKAELDRAAAEYDLLRQTYTDPKQIPRSYSGGKMSLVGSSDWTSGFIAGSFWYLYEHTADASWRKTAESWTDALHTERKHTSDHDVGFIIHNSYGNGYRLTSNAAYVEVLKAASAALVSRFNATVGAIRSWDYAEWTYPVIIDNMMNLELLWHTTELGGDTNFAAVALTHAQSTDKNHFRSDSSSFHVVDYDPATGNIIAKKTAQGIADSSAWARGQAWGLYGFTMAYRMTKDQHFLERALGIADFYTNNANMPSDGVPYFDFDAPKDANVPDHRDASAGAIAASAMLELHRYASTDKAQKYLAFALKALRSLSSSDYRARPNTNGHLLLLHSVGNYPQKSEIDVGINYADYYYLEGLLRCKALQ